MTKKDMDALLDSVFTVVTGKRFIDGRVAMTQQKQFVTPDEQARMKFLASKGLTNGEIAYIVERHPVTVAKHKDRTGAWLAGDNWQ